MLYIAYNQFKLHHMLRRDFKRRLYITGSLLQVASAETLNYKPTSLPAQRGFVLHAVWSRPAIAKTNYLNERYNCNANNAEPRNRIVTTVATKVS